jgi:3-(3-hydroxy-phenyl)propionate hydroxylase
VHDGSAHAGQVSAQPRLGDGRRLDDVAGYRAVLLVAPRYFESGGLRRELVVVAADSEASRDYLKHLDAQAVLIRPDRYIYGTASRSDELERLLDGFGATGRVANAA